MNRACSALMAECDSVSSTRSERGLKTIVRCIIHRVVKEAEPNLGGLLPPLLSTSTAAKSGKLKIRECCSRCHQSKRRAHVNRSHSYEQHGSNPQSNVTSDSQTRPGQPYKDNSGRCRSPASRRQAPYTAETRRPATSNTAPPLPVLYTPAPTIPARLPNKIPRRGLAL